MMKTQAFNAFPMTEIPEVESTVALSPITMVATTVSEALESLPVKGNQNSSRPRYYEQITSHFQARACPMR